MLKVLSEKKMARGVKRPATAASRPGTAQSRPTTSYSTRVQSRVFMAITESRGNQTEVGMAMIDLDSTECILSQVRSF